MRFLLATTALISLASTALSQSWNGYGENAQHTALFTGSSQTISKIHWQTPLDDDPSYYGGEVIIHYASMMVTPFNTVVHAYRVTTYPNGVPDYDNWTVIGRNGNTGAEAWQLKTDYSAPDVYPNGWTSVYPATLYKAGGTGTVGVVAGAEGGSVMVRSSADGSVSAIVREVFYTTLQDFLNNQAAYSPVKINTPLTADAAGNVYFGYDVTGSVPPNLSGLGTGGVVKLNPKTGQAIYRSVQALGVDSSLTRTAMNSAPALSNDGKSVYFALTGGDSVLVKLDTGMLSATAHVQLLDPSVKGAPAYLIDESSAAPMVGPDGHVFMGVFGYQWRESHGWMLQFDQNLNQTQSLGKLYPVGAFGWDDTPSVVPASIISSYHGKSTYLILTKYNNYDDNGGDPGADGSNKVAVIDPSSNSISRDRQSGIPVMNEVLTVLSPLLINNDPSHPNARYEWCINSAAVDVPKLSAIINCEDGHIYRWNFPTNSITEDLDLQPATGEAYTSTAIGPDGQIYAVNNAILFAIGWESKASAVSVYEGAPGTQRGSLSNIWYKDGASFSVQSRWDSGASAQVAAIEADFNFSSIGNGNLAISSYASGASAVTGFLYAYNYSTGAFVPLGTGPLGSAQTLLNASTANGAQFVSSSGNVRILLRALVPSHVSRSAFTLAADAITCSVN